MVLSPETTITFVVVFLFSGYAPTICNFCRLRRRLFLCAASSIGWGFFRAFFFRQDELPFLNIGISEGSLDSKGLL